MRLERFFFILIFFLNFLPSSVTQDSSPFIQVIYFRASDMPPRPNLDIDLDRFIKRAQLFYADEMERHGFGRKTFRIETDTDGNTVVHHVVGKFTYTYYLENGQLWEQEVPAQIDIPQESIPVYMVETRGQKKYPGPGCGHANYESANIYCFGWSTVAHELGHAFDFPHDFRDDSNIMSYGLSSGAGLSRCTAEWLDVHPFFNVGQPPMTKDEWSNASTFGSNQSTRNEHRGIKMLPPSLESPPNAIRLRFEVTDPDGLHHALLVLPGANFSLLGCKSLSGERSTIEFVTTELSPKDEVSLRVIDARGNTASSWHSIDIRPLLPAPEVVPIADPNLAEIVRKQLRLSPKDALTTHTLGSLRRFIVNKTDAEIKDFAALEYAHALTGLYIYENKFSDISSLAGLTQLIKLELWGNDIRDISPLAGLTKLTKLQLSKNNIRDISPLAGLTKLNTLYLSNNDIRDISPLAGLTKLLDLNLYHTGASDISSLSDLTQLVDLDLRRNNIRDISRLSGLTRLTDLALDDNSISDISPLAELTRLTYLLLRDNSISDISVLAGLTRLEMLTLGGNAIVDISALAGLTRLERLNLTNNNISDVSPLLALNLTGTTWDSTGLYLEGNPLSYASINTHIPALQAKGIEVTFDNVAHPALVKISGDRQDGTAGTPLASPLVLEAQDKKGQPMRDVPVTFTVHAGGGILSPTTTKTDAEGKARTFLTLGWTPSTTTIRATAEGMPAYVHFTATATVLADRLAEDVNGDGEVDVDDLLLVAASFGTAPAPGVMPNTDVNGDGKINNEDMFLVLAVLEGAPAAPVLNNTQWTVASLQQWITEAKRRNITDATFLKGIAVLEQWLAELLPKKTDLFANYPNPFNPETWIPYQLSKSAEVTLRIYAVNGTLVRTLAVGHQPAGMYHGKSRAAYWDGRNQLAERVASGVYFYTLIAGDFTATRKMIIRK